MYFSANRGVDHPDAARPRGVEVDPLGEAIPLQLADTLQPGCPLQHRRIDQRRAVADNEAVNVADPVEELFQGGGIGVRPEARPPSSGNYDQSAIRLNRSSWAG
jgi:hypothetical protein